MSSPPPAFAFQDPWWSTAEQNASFHEAFLNQLRLEVGADHILFGLPVKLIARHSGSDDAVFELLDGSGRVAVVHLTWATKPQRTPWPGTRIYQSLKAFADDEMPGV